MSTNVAATTTPAAAASTATATATPAWRTFTFFTPQSVSDRLDPGSAPQAFKSAPEISTITAGQGTAVVADIHGQVHICNADLEITRTFTAHTDGRVTHMKYAGSKGVLVTLGEEESSPHPVLKIWNTRHDDKRTGLPRLLASGRVQHGNRTHPVSTFATTASLSLVAIGLADGTVLLLRQLDQYIHGVTSASGPANIPKPKVVHFSPSDPITGLGFGFLASNSNAMTNTITRSSAATATAPTSSTTTSSNVILYIVTTHQVLTYITTPTGKALSGSSAHATVLDDVGAALNCCTMLPNGQLVIARDEAIFVYGQEGRGQSYFYEGSKSAISTFHNYIVITSPPFVPTASSHSATVRNFVREQRAAPSSSSSTSASAAAFDTSTDIAKVTIFDPENKFVAYSGAFPEGVREVFYEWGDVFVLTNDSKLTRLVERATQDKLGILFSKNLYLLAINLARSSGLEESEVAEIYKKYGDFLYHKGDSDGAMQQFIKTIGKVQPSYVIRKFLDGQRINNLTSYLQELHSQNFANSDITTLLLNCYAKLKDTDRLDRFIKSATISSSTGELPFDLETAIRVCRQAGYFDHAVYLAKEYNQPEEYLRIQIEDREEYIDSISYIRQLGQEAAEEKLRRYGKTLLANVPAEATDLLIDLCCGTLDRPARASDAEDSAKDDTQNRATTRTSYLSYLALPGKSSVSSPSPSPVGDDASPPAANAQAQRTSVRGPPSRRPTSATVTGATDAIRSAEGSDEVAGAEVDAELPFPASPTQMLPAIRPFFAHFIDRPAYFIDFLETVAARRWDQRLDEDRANSQDVGVHMHDDDDEAREQKAVWNTLIELYLDQSERLASDTQNREEDGAQDGLQRKALRLLKGPADVPFDKVQALLVCTSADFVPGILALYERMNMHEDILRYWMEVSTSQDTPDPENAAKASAEVVSALNKYGPQHGNSHLYPLVLRYLTSSPTILGRHQQDLLKVLEYIDTEKLMPPIAVVQALAKSGVASIGLVKNYLARQIQGEQEEIQADRALSESYKADIVRKEKEMATLSDPNAPLVFQATRCSACGGSLDLPAVHFMCHHSYHQRCLADNEVSCPTCANAHGLIREIKAHNEGLANRHDMFVMDLEDADDRFESIVESFSKGLVRSSEE